jgi:hypothetical protein
MNRTDIINFFIKKYDHKSYLEIGVSDPGVNFAKIIVDKKISVDPNVNEANFVMTSDDFFKENNEKFDVIFIDGLHESEQVYRDIHNSINSLNDGGSIILHDCNPHSEIIQLVPQIQGGEWTGDCWKAFVKFRQENNQYFTFVIDTDYGVGVIKKSNKGITPLVIDKDINYENFDSNRIDWLNLISCDNLENTLNNI